MRVPAPTQVAVVSLEDLATQLQSLQERLSDIKLELSAQRTQSAREMKALHEQFDSLEDQVCSLSAAVAESYLAE